MTPRSIHRTLGITMLLPLLAWAVTGAIFFIKPGYGAAYESLVVRTYPLESTVTVTPQPDWREIRHLRTTLGDHLLARTASGWTQIDPETRQTRPAPDESAIRALVSDAFTANPDRYGEIASVEGNRITTSTGARVTLDWHRLSLSQRGLDTDRIDGIYRIHYLQWTGVAWLDRLVGGLGLLLIVGLSAFGARLVFRRSTSGSTGRG